MLNEYSDQDGNRFNVYLSNTDAPAGMTKLEVRGTDRANLLGSLCTSLARMEISIVSGIISTGDDGIVRNTLFVRRQDRDDGNSGIIIGGRLEEEEFGPTPAAGALPSCWRRRNATGVQDALGRAVRQQQASSRRRSALVRSGRRSG